MLLRIYECVNLDFGAGAATAAAAAAAAAAAELVALPRAEPDFDRDFGLLEEFAEPELFARLEEWSREEESRGLLLLLLSGEPSFLRPLEFSL